MSLERFIAEPWRTSHQAYDHSAFNIRTAPEFATAEVVVASLYRASGFSGQSEKAVPATGRDFDKLIQRSKLPSNIKPSVSNETWRTILHGVLESPKQPNQSSRRFLQICPVVPDVALYSGSARLTGNSWNPGLLVQRMIQLGSDEPADAESLWGALFDSLSIASNDDIWARWLQHEFVRRKRIASSWG